VCSLRIRECVSHIAEHSGILDVDVARGTDGDRSAGYYGACLCRCGSRLLSHYAGSSAQADDTITKVDRDRDAFGFPRRCIECGLPRHPKPLQLRHAVFQSGGHPRSSPCEDRAGFALERASVRVGTMVARRTYSGRQRGANLRRSQ
jgi:hypothetical protein